MPTPRSPDPKRAPQEQELRRLRVLMWLTALQCGSVGCRRHTCRRTGRCRALARVERQFDLTDGFNTAMSRRLIWDLRAALRTAGWPPLCPGARRNGETLRSAFDRWYASHLP